MFAGVRAIQLPIDFTIKMKDLLKEDYDAFLKSFTEEQSYGLRLNSLKTSTEDFLTTSPFTLKSIPWTENGFYYDYDERPGKHPFHEAGLYYIQEPSAMAVVELMQSKPGEKILDLAAAPGGKTTHIAQYMNQQGLLVTNDIHPGRARILSENIERMGITNAVVTNETPERLAKRFPAFFDRILVDAPCSGEGMFRKNPAACDEWSLDNVEQCAIRQQHILGEARKMLISGGQLVYSTCTFSPEENEQLINQFVNVYPEFSIEYVDMYDGFSSGRKDWVRDPVNGIDHTVRIWPHHVRGEGHFVAVLRKNCGEAARHRYQSVRTIKNKKRLQDYNQFAKETLQNKPEGDFVLFGDELYIVPPDMINMDQLKVLRAGWHLGTNKKNRFEPSHALALALKPADVNFTWDLAHDSAEIVSFLKGETFTARGEKGWYLITVDGYSIGWGKLIQQTMKNHYPKGLRWMGV